MAQEQINTRGIVEAVLFASHDPLDGSKIARVLGVGNARDVRKHVKALNEDYEARNAVFRIEEVGGGFLMLTLPDYGPFLAKLKNTRQETRLSMAALETLAVVAYKQPIMRVNIEAVRGVACGEVLRGLMEKGLVKIVGRAEELGRPLLYGTTKKFLEVFGLASLKDLPKIEELPRPAQTPPPEDESGQGNKETPGQGAEEAAREDEGDPEEASEPENEPEETLGSAQSEPEMENRQDLQD